MLNSKNSSFLQYCGRLRTPLADRTPMGGTGPPPSLSNVKIDPEEYVQQGFPPMRDSEVDLQMTTSVYSM